MDWGWIFGAAGLVAGFLGAMLAAIYRGEYVRIRQERLDWRAENGRLREQRNWLLDYALENDDRVLDARNQSSAIWAMHVEAERRLHLAEKERDEAIALVNRAADFRALLPSPPADDPHKTVELSAPEEQPRAEERQYRVQRPRSRKRAEPSV